MSPDLDALLPHRGPMRLIDAVSGGAAGGVGWVRLDPGAWYADQAGRTPAWIGLELMAQTLAAWRGLALATAGSASRGGYLLGTRRFRSTVSTFPAGAELEIRVRLLEEDPSGLCSCHCEILQLGLPVAEATLNVMERP